MKTDTIFYTLFQTLPGVLFELLEQSQALASYYQFTSVEIKELARRIDGLFLPKPEFTEDTIYFVEVQFQRDDDIYWRIITKLSSISININLNVAGKQYYFLLNVVSTQVYHSFIKHH